VSLSEKTTGELKLLQQDMANTKDSIDNRVRESLEDIESMRLGIKECLESMQKSTVMFSEGNYRFQKIDGEMQSIRNDMSAARISAKEHSIEKIKNRMAEESNYRGDVDKRFRKAEWALFTLATMLILSHGHTVVSFFEKMVTR